MNIKLKDIDFVRVKALVAKSSSPFYLDDNEQSLTWAINDLIYVEHTTLNLGGVYQLGTKATGGASASQFPLTRINYNSIITIEVAAGTYANDVIICGLVGASNKMTIKTDANTINTASLPSPITFTQNETIGTEALPISDTTFTFSHTNGKKVKKTIFWNGASIPIFPAELDFELGYGIDNLKLNQLNIIELDWFSSTNVVGKIYQKATSEIQDLDEGAILNIVRFASTQNANQGAGTNSGTITLANYISNLVPLAITVRMDTLASSWAKHITEATSTFINLSQQARDWQYNHKFIYLIARTASNDYSYSFGFKTSLAGNPLSADSNSLQFVIDNAVNSGRITLRFKSTNIDTGITPAINTLYSCDIQYDSRKDEFRAYINNVLIHTETGALAKFANASCHCSILLLNLAWASQFAPIAHVKQSLRVE